MIELNPIKELTVDNVTELTIHSTRSSIRRAAGNKVAVTVPSSQKVPEITYIYEKDKDGNEKWTLHALSPEVTKFLLYKSMGSPSKEGKE